MNIIPLINGKIAYTSISTATCLWVGDDSISHVGKWGMQEHWPEENLTNHSSKQKKEIRNTGSEENLKMKGRT